MEKFPILCTLSALIVFLGAAVSAAGVQKVSKNDLPFGSVSVEQVQSSTRPMTVSSLIGRDEMASSASHDRDGYPDSDVMQLASDAAAVEIQGSVLVSF